MIEQARYRSIGQLCIQSYSPGRAGVRRGTVLLLASTWCIGEVGDLEKIMGWVLG